MDKEEENSFLIDMYEKGMSFFKMLDNIDMSNSDSCKPQDKVAIRDAAQREAGFDEVKKAIYKPLRDWTVGCLDQLYTAIQPHLTQIKYVYKSVTIDLYKKYILCII